jgi:RNA polymerase sigma-70 factor (family 1)
LTNYHIYSDDPAVLFKRLATGDHEAFRIIFHHYADKVFPHVLNIVKSKSIAEELVQDTFMKLWLNRETVSAMENQEGWIFTVASNLSFNILKKAASNEKALLELKSRISFLPDSNILEHKDQEKTLADAIKDLPAQRQLVFKLSREEGYTHQQIAEQLNISPNTVKNQLVTALRFIREYMRKAGAFFFL